ncbi:rho guanine nucleotide exchange factor 38 isoform X2 [Sminthopsis crassicaudata]|uniref:rho guanine nucleotide exchange factor 38 isoform X2 n=1 Tax=Sminthopsis crassicaudata TaxID=9301 RepID=UPI003D6961D8
METKEAFGKENMGTKKKNLTFLRQRLYMLERRKTDTLMESNMVVDHSNSGPLRRSQSDRTEYNQKLQGSLQWTRQIRLVGTHLIPSPSVEIQANPLPQAVNLSGPFHSPLSESLHITWRLSKDSGAARTGHCPSKKMMPQTGASAPGPPAQDEQQQIRRMMAKRSNIIKELIQTEKDYLTDLELCIREVVQPLKTKQIERFDADGLFSNIQSVHQISVKLLSLLEEATKDVEPDMQVIGGIFLQIKSPLEDIYKIYCYHHDEAHTILESYEKDEELKQHMRHCIQSLKGKPNLLDMGSLLIKPVQRVMKYPLLLSELRNSTPPTHPDYKELEDALAAMKDINVNINELKRRKDLVLKYKKNDEDESLKDKFSKLNIHSISKKSKRVTNHLKILTRGESQVKDRTFNREEKLFRHLEKTVKNCVKNVTFCLQHIQDAMPLAAQIVTELHVISYDKDTKDSDYSATLSKPPNPCEDFVAHLHRLVLTPLLALQSLFPGPQKLIQKRYDKLLDYNGYIQCSAGDDSDLARKDYEALNAQLVEELQVFNQATRQVLLNCLYCFVTLLRDLMFMALKPYSTIMPLLLLPSSINKVQNRVIEEVHSLNFVKDNSTTFIERKLSFEKKKPGPTLIATSIRTDPHIVLLLKCIMISWFCSFHSASVHSDMPCQTENHRSQLLASYSLETLYQAKRKCNATQEHDIDLLEGDLVAAVEQKDPLGSTNRWLVDSGIAKGFVYASFLKPYNAAKVQQEDREHWFYKEDFDNISLFVSSWPVSHSITQTWEESTSGNSSSLNGICGKPEVDGVDTDSVQDGDEQIFYAVHAFQARSEHELSLQEYQRVHILRFCDLSGNKKWWLAEAQGQKGYVPANYLGKMTYA